MIPSRSVLTVAVAAALCACVLAQVLPISDRFVVLDETEESGTYLAQDQESGKYVLVVHRMRLLTTESEVQVPTGRYTFSEDQRHEGIQFVFEIVYEVDSVTTVMEFTQGPSQSLQKLMSISNQLPIDRFVMLFARIVRAVHHCHRHGVVHGSINVDSILVTRTNVNSIYRTRTIVQLSPPLLPCLLPPSSFATADVFDLGYVLIHLLKVTVPSVPAEDQPRQLIQAAYQVGAIHASSPSSTGPSPICQVFESLLVNTPFLVQFAWILDQEYGAGSDPYITQILNVLSPVLRSHPIPELGPEQIAALRLIAHMIDPNPSTRWSMDMIVQSDLFRTFP